MLRLEETKFIYATKDVIEGDVEGYSGRGRPRMEHVIDMGKDSYRELNKELSYSGEAWRIAANQCQTTEDARKR